MRKVEVMNNDQKKMFLQAEHMNYAKDVHEIDEEMEYLE